MKECHNCSGAGVVVIDELPDGNFVMDDCPQCSGSGEEDDSCIYCGGSGGGPERWRCIYCHGSGVRK
jgi:DnaJ-class molecular chaperone